VTLEGEPDEEGMVVDFVEIKRVVGEKVLSKLDHSDLNEVLKVPSAENIAQWVWDQLDGAFEAKLYEVRVWETEGCFVVVRN